MGRVGQLRRVENRLRNDLEKTTNSLSALGKKYGVSRQALSNFVRLKGIKRPKREHPEECSICQALIGIANKPHSDFIPSHTLIKQLGIARATFLKHIRILRKRGIISKKFGTLHSMHSIPYETLKEIFPRRLERRDLLGRVYNNLKNMILSGEFMKGQRLVEEKLAQKFNVSRQPVHAAFLQLEKDKLIVRKGRKGTFVSFGP
jgi:DNA-binding transcriptional regulator YhcF (GntR family)